MIKRKDLGFRNKNLDTLPTDGLGGDNQAQLVSATAEGNLLCNFRNKKSLRVFLGGGGLQQAIGFSIYIIKKTKEKSIDRK